MASNSNPRITYIKVTLIHDVVSTPNKMGFAYINSLGVGGAFLGNEYVVNLGYLPPGFTLDMIHQGQVWWICNKTSYNSWTLDSCVGGIAVPPTGSITAFAGSTPPLGWMTCDGSAVSRTKYNNLFKVISTTYGSGDGHTTFNLPNLTNNTILGSGTTYTVGSTGTVVANEATPTSTVLHYTYLNYIIKS